MANHRELYFFNEKRRRVAAYFHEFKIKGKDTPRHVLCSYDTVDYKTLSNGKTIRRPKKEKKVFLDELRKKKLEELIEAREEKEASKPGGVMIKEAMQTWLDEVSRFRSKDTLRKYRDAANLYLTKIGDHPINDTQKLNFLKLRTVMDNKNYATATQHAYLSFLQTFFIWAEDNEVINKRIKIPKPQKTKKEPGVYTDKNINELISYLTIKIKSSAITKFKIQRVNQLRTAMMASKTGMRGGEIWSLPLSNINLDRDVIHIKDVPEIGFFVKSKHEETIPISKSLKLFLLEDFKQRDLTIQNWYIDNGKGNLGYSSEGKLSRPFRIINQQFGVVGVKPLHGFRAYAATKLLENGVEITTVQKLLRHKDITTTKGYQNTQNLPLRSAIEIL